MQLNPDELQLKPQSYAPIAISSFLSDFVNLTPNGPLNFQFPQFCPRFLSIKPPNFGALCKLVLGCQFLQFNP